jgi:hypothetical protein
VTGRLSAGSLTAGTWDAVMAMPLTDCMRDGLRHEDDVS